MKNVLAVFDLAVIIILLGVMLPVMFSNIRPLAAPDRMGFNRQEDKTMQFLHGEAPFLADLHVDDTFSAAEIILLTRSHARDTVTPNRWQLPAGGVIVIDEDYQRLHIDNATIQAQWEVLPGARYKKIYDYINSIWLIQER